MAPRPIGVPPSISYGGGLPQLNPAFRQNSTRPVGGSPSADPYGKLASTSASSQFQLDAEALQEIADIQMENEIALAEYGQRSQVANADADFQRRQIGRDIGIQNQYGDLATGKANESYQDLATNLQTLIPPIQQAYNQSLTNVAQAYDQGVAATSVPQVQAQSLESQLAQLTGGQTDSIAKTVSSPADEMSALLQGSKGTALQNLGTLGHGDWTEAQAAIPKYDEERQQVVEDISLDVEAQLSELRNELAGVHANFVPFNAAEMQLRTSQAIRDAVNRSMDRQEQATAEMTNLSGRRGVAERARQLGNPELAQEFFDMVAASEEPNEAGLSPSQVLNTLLNSYGNDRAQTTSRPSPSSTTRERGPRQPSRLGAGVGLAYGGLLGAGIGALWGSKPGVSKQMGALPTAEDKDAYIRETRRAEHEQRVLRELLDIYQGNY